MIRLAIFDWDDVFTIGSKEGYFACYYAALEALGIAMDEAEARKRILERWGSPHRVEFMSLLREHTDLVDAACLEYERQYQGSTFLSHLRTPGDLTPLLLRLHETRKLGIATGQNPTFLQERVFPMFKIPAVFDVIMTAYDVPSPAYHKPHPFMIERIMDETGIPAGETVMVGDARQDMEMAFNAGVRSVAVLTGHLTREAATKLGVDRIIESVMDIEGCIDGL
jgi:phosphoglycolate phosphatase